MARPKLDAPNYRLIQRGSRFYVRWWADGAWQRISTGETDQRRAAIWLAQFVAGRGTPEPPPAPTIALILTGYLADRKGAVAAYDTLEVATKALRRHLGDLQPDHLTTERARFYAGQRRAEGYWVGPADKRRKKVVADGTVLREVVTLRAALRWAVNERWIPSAPHIPAPSQPAPRDRWLTREEAARLLEHVKAPHVRLFVALALHTAARSGAVLELTWDRVDLKGGVIDFGAGSGNKRRGLVPINAKLRPLLESAREAATCPWVIEHGSRRVASVKTGFRAACSRASLEGVSPHVLRHTAVTWMVQAHVPMAMVARYASMSLEMVERRYGHHSPDWLRQAAEALEGLPAQQAPKTRSPVRRIL